MKNFVLFRGGIVFMFLFGTNRAAIIAKGSLMSLRQRLLWLDSLSD